jgi:hypothetical protein
MREIELGKYRKARVWRGELPPSHLRADSKLFETLSASLPTLKEQMGALEVLVPLGPRFMYGLIGGELRPGSDNELRIEIAVSKGNGTLFQNPLCGSLDQARIGLPSEYAKAVLSGIALAKEHGGIIAGQLAITHAAFGEIGSCEAVFKHLAAGLMRLLTFKSSEPSQQELINLFPQTFN